MRALTLKGNIDTYLRGIANNTAREIAKEELTAFYRHVTGICCLTPQRNANDGCDACGMRGKP